MGEFGSGTQQNEMERFSLSETMIFLLNTILGPVFIILLLRTIIANPFDHTHLILTQHPLITPTHSGKTLAFLIPLLKKLLGAIVLSPTRELAVQTFQVLRSIGSYHHVSAGLLVGS